MGGLGADFLLAAVVDFLAAFLEAAGGGDGTDALVGDGLPGAFLDRGPGLTGLPGPGRGPGPPLAPMAGRV